MTFKDTVAQKLHKYVFKQIGDVFIINCFSEDIFVIKKILNIEQEVAHGQIIRIIRDNEIVSLYFC